jgi:hypothetical protein
MLVFIREFFWVCFVFFKDKFWFGTCANRYSCHKAKCDEALIGDDNAQVGQQVRS